MALIDQFSPKVQALLRQAEKTMVEVDSLTMQRGATPVSNMEPDAVVICAIETLAVGIDRNDTRYVATGMLMCIAALQKMEEQKKKENLRRFA